MIFVTGDTHGGNDSSKLRKFKERSFLTKKDYVIILGDFGYIFYSNPNSSDEFYKLWRFTRFPWTTLFVDGNHENHFRLNHDYPVEEWNGGFVHKINDSVFHLMRGQVFDLNGKTFFTMGGAISIDKAYRTEGISWWKEEIPSYQEMDTALENLEKHSNQVDFILTHTCPRSRILDLESSIIEDATSDFLEEIYNKVKFSKWYFGHFHKDIEIPSDPRLTCLYQNLIQVV